MCTITASDYNSKGLVEAINDAFNSYVPPIFVSFSTLDSLTTLMDYINDTAGKKIDIKPNYLGKLFYCKYGNFGNNLYCGEIKSINSKYFPILIPFKDKEQLESFAEEYAKTEVFKKIPERIPYTKEIKPKNQFVRNTLFSKSVMRNAGIAAVILTLVLVIKPFSSNSGDFKDGGSFQYRDAINYLWEIDLHPNGEAFATLKTSPKSDIEKIAYKNVKKGVKGTWVLREDILRIGNNKLDYFIVKLPGNDMYISEDGFVYSSYNDMERQYQGFKYTKF